MDIKKCSEKKMLLTLAEAAALTSSSVSWWRAAARGEKRLPPGVEIRAFGGRSWRVVRASLEAWVAGEQQPVARRRGRPTKAEQQGR
ncbi:MAG: hypothetical protein V1782_01435 [Pseudomonadota bacterium]